ncbi:hypothetical protein [Brevibacillus dissolubilis]|nr:hypothetical protein [Brevibacillus dissolubilis]
MAAGNLLPFLKIRKDADSVRSETSKSGPGQKGFEEAYSYEEVCP